MILCVAKWKRDEIERRTAPSAIVDLKFKRKDVCFKTDEEGNPVVVFIGKALPNGKIKGKRYSRTLKRDAAGTVIKDHWDLKGKAD